MIKRIVAAVTALAWLPTLGRVAALAVADVRACALDEGRVHPRLVLGWLGWGLYSVLRRRA